MVLRWHTVPLMLVNVIPIKLSNYHSSSKYSDIIYIFSCLCDIRHVWLPINRKKFPVSAADIWLWVSLTVFESDRGRPAAGSYF